MVFSLMYLCYYKMDFGRHGGCQKSTASSILLPPFQHLKASLGTLFFYEISIFQKKLVYFFLKKQKSFENKVSKLALTISFFLPFLGRQQKAAGDRLRIQKQQSNCMQTEAAAPTPKLLIRGCNAQLLMRAPHRLASTSLHLPLQIYYKIFPPFRFSYRQIM